MNLRLPFRVAGNYPVMTSRRNFIRQLGFMSAAMCVHSNLSAKDYSKKLKTIGLQLYSLRSEIGKDVRGVMQNVARAGYQDVEVYGYNTENKFWGLDPKQFSSLLKEFNLKSTSGHYGIDEVLRAEGNYEQLKQTIEAAHALNHTYITVPYLDEKIRKTADDYKKIAVKLNKAGELCKKAGLKLAYHNHAFEFQPMGNTSGYDVLLNECEPSLVDFELDLYWAVRAKADPVTLFSKHPGRFPLWHVKDMNRAKPEQNTEVGKGSIDFKAIMNASKTAGLKHLFVEQENFDIDPFVSIKESCNYIKANLL